MEKKYLETLINGRIMGAFDNVRNFTQTENSVSFDSDDGSFTYTKDASGMYRCPENNIKFDSCNLICRRTLLNHGFSDSSNRAIGSEPENSWSGHEAPDAAERPEGADEELSEEEVEELYF